MRVKVVKPLSIPDRINTTLETTASNLASVEVDKSLLLILSIKNRTNSLIELVIVVAP